MKKVLVIFHVYYPEQIPFFLEKMQNIVDVDWDLLVTGSNLSGEVKSRISSFKPDASFLSVANIGYDIGPFIEAVKSVDISRYGIVLKLHTKNVDEHSVMRLNGDNLCGHRWRDTMVNALLGSPLSFRRVLRRFESGEDIGMAYSLSVNCLSRGATLEDSSQLLDELERIGLKPGAMEFCAGTIFAVRAEALSYLQKPEVTLSCFAPSIASHSTGTMAHTYERILSIAVFAQGYRAALIPEYTGQMLYYRLKRTVQPALEWIFSIDYRGNGRQKYLTLCGLRFRLS